VRRRSAGNHDVVNIFHVELSARSHTFFSWWTPPEPLLEEHAPRVDAVVPPAVDATRR
jgi:hypothetical protein